MGAAEGPGQKQPSAGWAWHPADGASIGCGGTHDASLGRFDERVRRLSHEELFVAQVLVREGHDVRSQGERRDGGRTADLLVCGTPLEVKSWLDREQRGGLAPRASSVVNKLLQAEGQAPAVVLNARGSGLTAAVAQAGMAEYAELRRPMGVTGVRVLGDGFDLGWAQIPSVSRAAQLGRTRADRGARLRRAEPNHHDLGVGP
jgi:hypothetical protein